MNIIQKSGYYGTEPIPLSTSYNAWSTDGKSINLNNALYLDGSMYGGNIYYLSTLYISNPLSIKDSLKVGTIYGKDSQSAASKVRTWSQSGENIDLQNYLKCQYTDNGYKLYLTYSADNNLVDSSVTKFLDLYNKTETNTLLDKKFGYITQNIYSDRILTQFFTNKDNIIQELDHIITPIRTSTLVGLMSPRDVTRINRSIQQMDTLYNRESRSYDILYNTNNMEYLSHQFLLQRKKMV